MVPFKFGRSSHVDPFNAGEPDMLDGAPEPIEDAEDVLDSRYADGGGSAGASDPERVSRRIEELSRRDRRRWRRMRDEDVARKAGPDMAPNASAVPGASQGEGPAKDFDPISGDEPDQTEEQLPQPERDLDWDQERSWDQEGDADSPAFGAKGEGASRAAGSHVAPAQAPKHGCAKSVIILIVVMSVLLTVIPQCTVLVVSAVSDSLGYYDDGYTLEQGEGDALEEDEGASRAAVEDALNAAIKEGDFDRDALKKRMSDYIKEDVGYSAEDMNLDLDALIDRILGEASYEIDYASAYDGEGLVSFTVTAPNAYDVYSAFWNDAWGYLWDEGLLNSNGDAKGTPLTSAQVDHLSELFDQALTGTMESRATSCAVDTRLVGDAWELDQDEFTSELAYVLGMY